MGLRYQLLLSFFILSAVTVLFAGYFILNSVIADKKNYITELNSLLSPQIAESLDQKISSLKIELLSLLTFESKKPANPEFLNQLTKIKTQFPEVKAIFFGDGKNELKSYSLVTSPDELQVITAVSDRLKQAKDIPTIRGQLTHLFDSVYAMADAGLFVAIVLTSDFYENAFKLARGRSAVLIDKNNRTLFELNTASRESELYARIPKDVLRNTDLVSMQIESKTQNSYLVNFARPKNLGDALIMVLAPAPSVRELLKPIINPSIGLFAILFFLSFLAAFWISQKMATPIEDLADWANQVGQGNWSPLKLQNTGPEISVLSKSFQNMMESLQARESDLKHAQYKIIHAESLAAVGRMSAGIAHEVKNPLGSVLGYAQLINLKIDAQKKKGDVAAVIPTVEEYVRLMMDDTRRASKIISDLLTFSRQKEIERRSISVQDYFKSISKKLVSFCESAESEIVIESSHINNAIQFEIDAEQLYQVLFNLTQNAVHAVSQKPKGNRKIEITISTQNLFVMIEVKDHGTGIAPENLKKVFEPFFSTKQVGEGTGLGLAICHGIVLQHGGSIEVDSVVDQFTCFKIKIPHLHLKTQHHG